MLSELTMPAPDFDSDLMAPTALLSLPDTDRLEVTMLQFPQVHVPVTHEFAPGIYKREVVMPKHSLIVGHRHKTRHFNIVLSGRVSVMINGTVTQIVAPCSFVSEPGVRKVLFCHEETRWATIHPTDETDVEKLEEALVIKTDAYWEHETAREASALRDHIEATIVKPPEITD